MTGLPWGFTHGETPPTEPPHRCWLGKNCSDSYRGNRCKFHEWSWDHDDAWMFIRGIGIAVVLGIIIIIALENDLQNNVLPARDIIDGFNCGQLAEYVADRSSQYSYAEHRYEWLCVNEQIKEFSG